MSVSRESYVPLVTPSLPDINVWSSYVPQNYVTTGVASSIQWESPDDVVSAATKDLVQRIKTFAVVPLCVFIGGTTNCLNMAVFFKQGVHERINMCLFTLSFIDFLYLMFIFFLYGERTVGFSEQPPRSVDHL